MTPVTAVTAVTVLPVPPPRRQPRHSCHLYCPTLIVAPLTTQTGKKPNQPTHYKLAGDGKAIRPSTVLLEQITTIDKRRVSKRLSRLDSNEMDRMKEHILMSLGIHIPEEVEAP